MSQETCHEELGADHNFKRCNRPAEFILWGKLLPPEALGPRCYTHAADHVGDQALGPNSGRAIYHLPPETTNSYVCLTLTDQDIEGMAEAEGIPVELARQRAEEWGRHIQDHVATIANESMSSAITTGQV